MRKIEKRDEPRSLMEFKRRNPCGAYGDLTALERQDIRKACTQEQYFLCAYCCQEISGEKHDTMNEHVEAQRLAPNRTVDFGNIVASCTTRRQCDSAHGSQALSLTPLMDECESEMSFSISGRAKGLTPRAKETIRVLNLGDTEVNNKALIERRKSYVDALIWSTYCAEPDKLFLEDDATLLAVVEDLAYPVDGKLSAFAPILASILKSHIDA